MTLTTVINPVVTLNLLFPLQRVICPQSSQAAKYRIVTHNFTNDNLTNRKSPSYHRCFNVGYFWHQWLLGIVIEKRLNILASISGSSDVTVEGTVQWMVRDEYKWIKSITGDKDCDKKNNKAWDILSHILKENKIPHRCIQGEWYMLTLLDN